MATSKEEALEKLLNSKSEALRRVGFEIQQQLRSQSDWPDSWSDSGWSDAWSDSSPPGYGDFWSNSSDGRWWDYQKGKNGTDTSKPESKKAEELYNKRQR